MPCHTHLLDEGHHHAKQCTVTVDVETVLSVTCGQNNQGGHSENTISTLPQPCLNLVAHSTHQALNIKHNLPDTIDTSALQQQVLPAQKAADRHPGDLLSCMLNVALSPFMSALHTCTLLLL
jgi:hypothetical protein